MVVIVTTILLVFLVKDRNVTQQTNSPKKVSSTNSEIDAKTLASISLTPGPTTTPAVTNQPTKPVIPTKQPTKSPVVVKTSPVITKQPTTTNKPSSTPQPTIIAIKPSVTPAPKVASSGTGKSYTVAVGDTLWKIAEQHYGSGYNWVDIAKTNNIDNPNMISAGTKLTIPSVEPKLKTVASAQDSVSDSTFGPKITGTSYTVQKGDHLWGIAVRSYNDGYKWVEIAKVNNISSPNIIFSGQVLKIPRN